MSLLKIKEKLEPLVEVPRDLLLGRYPDFVTGGALPRGQVPVFVFHSLEPVSFERKLAHLKDNGYVTLSADEYLALLEGKAEAPDRAVLLTFDDGRGSLWSVGYPLLRRYGMRGLVFLVADRMAGHAATLPTWDDVRDGRVPAEEVLGRERGGGAFLSWDEVEVLARAEVYSFHSHTLRHARVHTEPRVVTFLSPDHRAPADALDVPLVRARNRDLTASELPLGTPLLVSRPRTSEWLRFFEDPGIREACVAWVAEESGEAFFERPGFERRLRRLVPDPIPGRLETPAEREAAIRGELLEAKARIEAHTGSPVEHLCYPWHTAGPTARRLAAEVGYRTAFCGKVRGVPVTLRGGDLLSIARVGEDYLELLPGKGRGRLVEVLLRKWRRRVTRGGAP
jgi:peptidoglycan/xylan/chitin deacetylase (PgdA/CDA1 family)